METLEAIYHRGIKKIPFLERKISLKEENSIIIGVTKSGKTSLIFDYISRKKISNYIYIDMSDTRNSLKAIDENLEEFCNIHSIELVVIENYAPDASLPNVKQLILTTERPLAIPNFTTHHLYPLDFEEFLSFNKKFESIEHAFSRYLKIGSFPSLHSVHESFHTRYIQQMLQLALTPLQFKIVEQAALMQALKISAFQMFERLKESTKISKDHFYANFKKLQQRNYITLVEKFGHPKAAKKIYLVDFIFKQSLTYQKNLSRLFESLLFNELQKRGERLYYLDGVEFYTPLKYHIIVSMPYPNEAAIEKRLELIAEILGSYPIRRVDIVTMGYERIFEQFPIPCSATPFIKWALIEN